MFGGLVPEAVQMLIVVFWIALLLIVIWGAVWAHYMKK